MSEIETVLVSFDSVSCIWKAIVESCSLGWAEAWQAVGSIDLKLYSCQQVQNQKLDLLTLFLESLGSMLRCSLGCERVEPWPEYR